MIRTNQIPSWESALERLRKSVWPEHREWPGHHNDGVGQKGPRPLLPGGWLNNHVTTARVHPKQYSTFQLMVQAP